MMSTAELIAWLDKISAERKKLRLIKGGKYEKTKKD